MQDETRGRSAGVCWIISRKIFKIHQEFIKINQNVQELNQVTNRVTKARNKAISQRQINQQQENTII
jgi:hypothetical protein